MSIYEQGWLARFLNPNNQPQEIKEYLKRENELLQEYVLPGSLLIDFGCGYGRHLQLLAGRLVYGFGIDTDEAAIRIGQRVLFEYKNLRLCKADCRNPKLDMVFDYAICMNNTLGNITEKKTVIQEMKKAVTPGGTCIFGVYNIDSVQSRTEWYRRTGLRVRKINKEYIETQEGFRSYHFSREKICTLTHSVEIHAILGIGYFVVS